MPKYSITFRYQRESASAVEPEHLVHVEAENESVALELARSIAAAERPELHIGKAGFWSMEREI